MGKNKNLKQAFLFLMLPFDMAIQVHNHSKNNPISSLLFIYPKRIGQPCLPHVFCFLPILLGLTPKFNYKPKDISYQPRHLTKCGNFPSDPACLILPKNFSIM